MEHSRYRNMVYPKVHKEFVTWADYRAYTSMIERIAPSDRDTLSTMDMTEIMYCAAWLSGLFADGSAVNADDPVAFLHEFRESLAGEHPGNVIQMLDDFLDFHVSLRTPDPK
jgi:hypothetical protein